MIRAATAADTPVLIEMGRALHDESKRYSERGFAPEKLEALARSLFGTATTEGEGGAFVAEKDGKVIGMLIGFVREQWFSYDKLASDYTFYVRPEHRGSMAAVRLIKAFEAWAISKGAVDILPGVSTMIASERARDLYLALGYEHYGYSMLKKVKR